MKNIFILVVLLTTTCVYSDQIVSRERDTCTLFASGKYQTDSRRDSLYQNLHVNFVDMVCSRSLLKVNNFSMNIIPIKIYYLFKYSHSGGII